MHANFPHNIQNVFSFRESPLTHLHRLCACSPLEHSPRLLYILTLRQHSSWDYLYQSQIPVTNLAKRRFTPLVLYTKVDAKLVQANKLAICSVELR